MSYALPKADGLRPLFRRDGFAVVSGILRGSALKQWQQQAQTLTKHARTVVRRNDRVELAYKVVTGGHIRNHWRDLLAFYTDSDVLKWLMALTDDPKIRLSPHLQSAVNLNILDTKDFQYRWHFDAVAYTAILYLTDVRREDGGALCIIPNCRRHVVPDVRGSKIVELWPQAGSMVVMDGTRCYHSVGPMLREASRLSIPLVFPNVGASPRPAGLDAYLYGHAA
jgi:hypothetical protein